MASLDIGYLDGLRFDTQQLAILRAIGQSRGREELFLQRVPERLEALRQSAIVESIESSNRIEGVTAAEGRVADLVERSALPRDRSEQELAGYRDALELIHDSAGYMPFTPNIILQLHSTLFRYLPREGGHWKPVDNVIEERDAEGNTRIRFRAVQAVATPQAVETLTSSYNRALEQRVVDPLVLIPLAVLDLLCIHPFHDGNGRIARLVTYMLLRRASYGVGRYISLERLVEASKDSYYHTLERSSQGWHEGRHDSHPWLNYFWGVLLAAYGELETRMETLEGSKTEQVREAVWRRTGPFSISDIEHDCPGVSRDMVRHVLRQMKAEQLIELMGVGRGARWRRCLSPTEPTPSIGPLKSTDKKKMSERPRSTDDQVRFAIANKRLIQFLYNGSVRVAEPHDYGVQNGITRLLVYQLRGPVRSTRSGATGWRLLDFSKVEQCVALEETFPGSRGGAHRDHYGWEVLHARVA